jgi:hypothetical protein
MPKHPLSLETRKPKISNLMNSPFCEFINSAGGWSVYRLSLYKLKKRFTTPTVFSTPWNVSTAKPAENASETHMDTTDRAVLSFFRRRSLS